MQDTHNELSPEELKVISDTRFFKLKSEITHKIEASLAILGENISVILNAHANKLPEDLLKIAPKISRGEQYKGLPWLILDYPRVFSGENTYAFRSMFWWGNYFSFTIHLAGKYFQPIKRKLTDTIATLHKKDFYLCVSDDQWQHHFEKPNYVPLDEVGPEEIKSLLEKATFIKLGRKTSLGSLSKTIDYGEETYNEFMKMLY